MKKNKKNKLKLIRPKKCCDPHGVHKTNFQLQNLRPIRENLIEKAEIQNIVLNDGEMICVSCKSRIDRHIVFSTPSTSTHTSTGETQTQQSMDISDDSEPEKQKHSSSSSSMALALEIERSYGDAL